MAGTSSEVAAVALSKFHMKQYHCVDDVVTCVMSTHPSEYVTAGLVGTPPISLVVGIL